MGTKLEGRKRVLYIYILTLTFVIWKLAVKGLINPATVMSPFK